MTAPTPLAPETVAAPDLDGGERLFCSGADAGWRSALVRVADNAPVLDETPLPPVPDQIVILVDRGVADVEVSAAGGAWRHARLGPGSVSLTAPGRAVSLRWRPTRERARHRTTHLYVPAAVLVGRGAHDGLDLRDDLLAAEVQSAVRAARAGEGDLAAEEVAHRVGWLLSRRPALDPARRDDIRVRRAVERLRAELAQQVSLADLAADAGLSPFHFARVFRATIGEPPHCHLTRLRIDQASRMLRQTDEAIATIAYGCGFASPAHFTSVFRRRTGSTPGAYRRAYAHRK